MSEQIFYNPAPRGNTGTKKQVKNLLARLAELEARVEKLEKKPRRSKPATTEDNE